LQPFSWVFGSAIPTY